MTLSDFEKQILLQIALEGGSANEETLKVTIKSNPTGSFRGYKEDYLTSMLDNILAELKRKTILSGKETGILIINERGILEEVGGNKEDIAFFLMIQSIQQEITKRKVFDVNKEELLPSSLEDLSEEIQTAYKLFKNAETPNDYSLVIASCGRAVEKIKERLNIEPSENEKKRAFKSILNGCDLVWFMRNKKGAHPEKEPTKLDALSCIVDVSLLCKLIEEYRL